MERSFGLPKTGSRYHANAFFFKKLKAIKEVWLLALFLNKKNSGENKTVVSDQS